MTEKLNTKNAGGLNKSVSAVKRYFKRVMGYDPETKAAFFVVGCALVNIVLCLIAVFAVAVYLLARKNGKTALKKYNRLAFVFALYTLVVAVVNLNYFGILASFFFASALFIMVVFRDNMTLQKIEDVFSGMVGYSIIAFAIAVIQLIFSLSADNDRSASTFVNPLYYCYYVSFVIVICVYRIIYSGKYRKTYAAVVALNIFAMLLTGSKMPWIGAVGAIVVMLFLCKKWKVLGAFFGCLVVALGVFWLLKDHGLREFLNMNGLTDSYAMRIPYWKNALEGIIDKPVFGHGLLGILKNSVDETLNYGKLNFDLSNLTTTMNSLKTCGWELHAHNIAFDCLYNYGIFGSLFFLFIIVQKCWYLFRDSGFRTYDPFVSLVAGAMTFILVDGIVDCQIIGIQTLFISVFLFSTTGIYKKVNEEII